ncbi:hypothetical protein ACIGHG_02450 [Bacillus sp. NPDC077411]
MKKQQFNCELLPFFVLKLCAWQEKALTAPIHSQSLPGHLK